MRRLQGKVGTEVSCPRKSKNSKFKSKMEDSVLNKAHQQHRRAEAHIRFKRFDEAIECHKKAADQLEEAKKLTMVAKALESLQLQQDFHNSQEDFIRMKKNQFEIYKKAVESQRQKMRQGLGKPEEPTVAHRDSENSNLQMAIYRTMEEADSLMEYLMKRGTGSETDSLKSECEDIPSSSNDETTAARVEWSKRPKDDHTVIEELRTLNHQLRSLVVQLVTQLDAKSRESDEWRQRVRQLEASHVQGVGSVPESSDAGPNQSLHVITDSTGNCSPFVFSPCSELSPEVVEPHTPRVLPVLAPLEMPNFDFSVFIRQQPDGEL